MKAKTKKEKLAKAIELLNEADSLVQEAVGHSDLGWDIHLGLMQSIDDIEYELEEMDD